ncbi:MAG: FmdB family zinc ribbon protein [Gemmatimonadaceae bacterium]
MPLYEFRCPNGHEFEQFYRSIGTASSEAACPVCGAVSQRMMSPAGLVFKGSGFYITDYGKDGKKAEREATAAKDKADTKSAAAGAESGSASKAVEGSSTPSAKPAESSVATTSSTTKAPSPPTQSKKTSE